MKKVGIIFVLVLSLVLSSCSPEKKSDTAQKDSEQGQANSGQQGIKQEQIKIAAPDFELDTLKGNKIKLSDLKGKVVVVNFFATWCPPCRAEMPGFISTMEEYEKNNADVVFLFVDVDEEGETVKEFLKERNYTIDPLMDNGDVYAQYTLRGGIPTTTIVDAEGNVAAQHEGLMESGDLKAYIEKALKK